jgi:hypothetical protein
MRRSDAACPVLEIGPAVDEGARLRALERLYLRREVVDELIRSLETYKETGERRHAPCIPISGARKCS